MEMWKNRLGKSGLKEMEMWRTGGGECRSGPEGGVADVRWEGECGRGKVILKRWKCEGTGMGKSGLKEENVKEEKGNMKEQMGLVGVRG